MIDEALFVYCNDLKGLINMFKPRINKQDEWRSIYRCFKKKV